MHGIIYRYIYDVFTLSGNMCMYVCVYVCVCICIYIYIYMCMYVYICIYIGIYIYVMNTYVNNPLKYCMF